MYFGHLGVGLFARGLARGKSDPPLWLLLFASSGPDWVETILIAGGVRHPALHSHGLPGALLGCAAFAAAGALLTPPVRDAAADQDTRQQARRNARTIAALFVAHLFCDFLTGYKPTWPGGPRIGLRLYDYPLLDFVVEAAFLIVGWAWYRRTLPRAARQHPNAWLMLLALLAGQALFDMFFANPDSPLF